MHPQPANRPEPDPIAKQRKRQRRPPLRLAGAGAPDKLRSPPGSGLLVDQVPTGKARARKATDAPPAAPSQPEPPRRGRPRLHAVAEAKTEPRPVGWRVRASDYPQERLLLGELHLVRQRLDDTLLGIAHLLATTQKLDEWERVGEAARIGSRALAAAIAAAPPLTVGTALAEGELQVRELRIDPASGRQWFGDQELELTALQHRLLLHLARDPYRVFAKAELLRDVWGRQPGLATNAVNTCVAKLGQRLARAGANRSEWLINLHGVGWALTQPDEQP